MPEGTEVPVRPGVEATLMRGRIPEVSFQEVRRLVSPEGACKYLDAIRVGKRSVGQEVSPYMEDVNDDKKRAALAPVVDHAEGKSSELKQVLNEALQNTGFLQALSILPKDAPIDRATIKQTLNLANIPLIERMDAVLNHGVDPEMIPLALRTTYGMEILEDIFQSVSRNELLRQRLTSIVTNYTTQFYRPNFEGESVYPEDMMHELNGFMNACIYDISQTPSATEAQLASARAYLEHFFRLDREKDPSGTVTGFYERLRSGTLGQYFEYKHTHLWYDKPEDKEQWIPYSGQELLSRIKSHAEAADKGRYLVMLYQKTKDIYEAAFPEVYVDPDVEKLVLVDPQSGRDESEEPPDGFNEANGSFHPAENAITIKAGTVVKKGGTEAFDEETFSMLGQRMRRKTAEAVTMAHEFTHAIYQNIVHGGKKTPKERENYQSKADHAINEGLAVTMEFLFIDFVKTHPELLDLDERDIADLENWKTKRLYSLKKDKSGYTEGTFWIWHDVFTEGAGKRNERDISAGLTAVRRFADSLDPSRTMSISREDPDYKALLKKNNPDAWAVFFSRPVEVAA